MFTVEVRDHIMIAHSFRGAVFGPAQALHGATFVVDAAFIADTLDANGIVVDIGRAHDTLKEVLKPLNYRNLDDVPEFKGKNTTTEFLTKYIFDRLAHHAREGDLGRPGRELNAIRVSIGEVARGARLLRGAVVVKRVAFAVPGDLATPTGGYAYDRRMIAELQKLGWQVDVIGLGDGFPRPSAESEGGGARKACRRAEGVSDRRRRPGLRRVAGGRAASCASEIRCWRWCIIRWRWKRVWRLPTRKPSRPASARRLRRRAASSSPALRPRTLLTDDYDVPPDIITVARPGTDRGEAAKGSSDGIVRLLSVGSVVPRKGYDVLIAALAPLADLPWRLTIAGDRTRDEAAAAQLDADIASHGLAERIDVLGALPADRLASALCRRPICSCWRRASRATAWPTPRRWRTACRWSAPRRAPFPTPCRPTPACWSSRTTSRR